MVLVIISTCGDNFDDNTTFFSQRLPYHKKEVMQNHFKA